MSVLICGCLLLMKIEVRKKQIYFFWAIKYLFFLASCHIGHKTGMAQRSYNNGTNSGDNQGEKQIDWHWVLTSCLYQALWWTLRMKRWTRLDPYFLSVLLLLFPKVQVGLYMKHTFSGIFFRRKFQQSEFDSELLDLEVGKPNRKLQWVNIHEKLWDLAERYSWKWEMKTMWKTLGKGLVTPVVLITPNSSVDAWHRVCLWKGFTKNQVCPGPTWLVGD